MDTTHFIENEHGRFRLKVWVCDLGADNGWLWSVCIHNPPGGWKQAAQGFSYLQGVAERDGLTALLLAAAQS